MRQHTSKSQPGEKHPAAVKRLAVSAKLLEVKEAVSERKEKKATLDIQRRRRKNTGDTGRWTRVARVHEKRRETTRVRFRAILRAKFHERTSAEDKIASVGIYVLRRSTLRLLLPPIASIE